MTRFRLGPQCVALAFAVLVISSVGQRMLWPGQPIDDLWTPALAVLLPWGYATAIHPGGRAVFGQVPSRWRWASHGMLLTMTGSSVLDDLLHGAITRSMEVVGYGLGVIGLVILLPIVLYLRLTLP